MFDMGKRICKLRRDAHLSQKQLGEKIGKSASTIGSYENDTAVAPPGTVGVTRWLPSSASGSDSSSFSSILSLLLIWSFNQVAKITLFFV